MQTSKNGELLGATWEEMGVNVPSGKSGKIKTICPICTPTRKPENQNDPSLSVDTFGGVANCHNCGQMFILDQEGYLASANTKKYRLPPQTAYKDVSSSVAQWFKDRAIEIEQLKQAKVTSGLVKMPGKDEKVNTIQFNYYDKDTIVNTKFRTTDKRFKMVYDAKLIFYNLNALYDPEIDFIVIVEGEIDALSYMRAGISNVISVPNGASKGSLDMEYLNNHYHLFEDDYRTRQKLKPFKRIVIATDDDDAGKGLRNEFVRRFGADRCYFATFNGKNDPNELLMDDGVVALFNTIDKATAAPIQDVITVSDMHVQLALLQKHGLQPGAQVGTKKFKELLSFEFPRMTVITGVSTHGKSEYADDIMSRLAVFENWRFGVFSPENFPIEYHISKLVSKIIGKAFNDCTPTELDQAYDFISRHFFWIYPENDDYSLENILRINDLLIKRYGVNGLIIDPWTEVDKKGKTDTEGINDWLSMMNRYKREKNVHMFIVAHPTKMAKGEDGKVIVPDLMNISGSANFLNKTDGGITVYRDFESNTVEIYVNKVKFKHLGKQGSATMMYNLKNGRYEDMDVVNSEGYDDSNWLSREEQTDLFDNSTIVEEADINAFLESPTFKDKIDHDDVPF